MSVAPNLCSVHFYVGPIPYCWLRQVRKHPTLSCAIIIYSESPTANDMHFWEFLFSYCMIKSKRCFIWSRRRGSVFKTSVSGWRTFLYAWFMVDKWPLRGLNVRCGSTNQSNSAYHPLGVGLVSSNPCIITWIAGVETIKTGRSELRMAVRSQVKVLWPRA